MSGDQLVSPTRGFPPIHWVLPTKKCYISATIFVDHYSDITYCHLMTEMNSITTVESKTVFECLSSSHTVHARHYHCENGSFDTKKIKSSAS